MQLLNTDVSQTSATTETLADEMRIKFDTHELNTFFDKFEPISFDEFFDLLDADSD